MNIQPYKISIEPEKVQLLQQHLALYQLPARTYENAADTPYRGVKYDWMEKTVAAWKKFDWTAKEKELNEMNHFMAQVPMNEKYTNEPKKFNLHFIHQKSSQIDSIPLLLLHGWPGSFLEFIQLAKELKDSKFDLIIPSLPGMVFSTGLPLDRDVGLEFSAEMVHAVMIELGYEGGYAIQGGDIGSFLGRVMAAKYPKSVKALHLNYMPSAPPISIIHSMFPHFARESSLLAGVGSMVQTIFGPFLPDLRTLNTSAEEKVGITVVDKFNYSGRSYSSEHATRPSTIGFVLDASPVACLAWVGEKFLEWSDVDISEEEILTSVSLYWFTGFATTVHAYRELFGFTSGVKFQAKEWIIKQPCGFSSFPKEITPIPLIWAKTKANVRWHRQHSAGGHFAAAEQSKLLAQDLKDCFEQIYPRKAKF